MTKIAGIGHNHGATLLSYVERVERLTEEKNAIGADIKEVWGEVKAQGFDASILRKIVQRRKRDPQAAQEQDAMVDLYERAIEEAAKAQVQQSIADGA